MTELTLEQALQKKADLEVEILHLLKEYEEETGLNVSALVLERLDVGPENWPTETVINEVWAEIKL